MKVAFLGTPDLAVPSLDSLHRDHDVRLVITQPDRPRGRGRHVAPPPVKERALALGLEVWQPPDLESEEVLRKIGEAGIEGLAVVAYGHFISDDILEAVRHGAVNLHFSLLPAYRGAAPVNWAIIRGERQTGITTFRITAKMDAGPVYLKKATPIREHETAGELARRLAVLGAPLLSETLEGLHEGTLLAEPQNENHATRAPKMKKEDGRISWDREARSIVRHVLGVNPWPGAFTLYNGRPLKIWGASVAFDSSGTSPGTILAASAKDGLRVAAAEGAVAINELQPEGKRRMTPEEYLAGHVLTVGSRFR